MGKQWQLGIVGGGVMGTAIFSRLIAQGIYGPKQIIVGEPNQERRAFLAETYGVETTADNAVVWGESMVRMLAIKPQILALVAADLVKITTGSDEGNLIISILAGTTIAQLENLFPAQPIIRVMPNTPSTVGQGMTAIAGGSTATAEHLTVADNIFGAVGEVLRVSESMMDGVTAVSGSGPAFVALMTDALIDGGVWTGLPRPIAKQLAIQTLLGTATLLKAQGLSPAELKDQVTSPGGTTIAGVAQLEMGGMRAAVMEAVRKAYERSRELGN
jgi:pyrroline-5-carboxylate reductase